MYFRKIRCSRVLRSHFLQWLFASLLALAVSHTYTPAAHAQFPNLSELNSSSSPQPSIDYIQRGNIHIANVRLDGVPLFKVATPAANGTDAQNNVLPIEWRVNEIETNLAEIVNGGFDPKALQVKAQSLNNQTVLVAEAGQDWKLPLMTITELDRQVDSTSNALSDIAEARAEKIKAALVNAHEERQPEGVRQAFLYLSIVVLIVLFTSLLLWQLQRLLRRQWHILRAESEKTVPELTDADTASEWTTTAQAERARFSILSFTKQRNINSTLRSLLWWGQISLWLAGAIVALVLFPQTRGAGIWLFGVPVSFIAILLALSMAKKVIDFLIVYGLKRWAGQDALRNTSDQRVALRIPTIANVLQEVTLYAVISVGILLFLDAIRAPLALVITGLGLVGFSAQNLIKDWIAGFLILWEDQYTQGDVVKIGDRSGIVEYLNLRITQLRTLEGKLVTIANGSFTTAVNFTHQWSQVDLSIDVAYSTDLDQAITVIEDVAVQMRQDPNWKEFIREPPTILGVDAFADNSIKIRLLIKTQPMKQWDVGREYRRRLKQAFDSENITIPFPQRSIWIEGASFDIN